MKIEMNMCKCNINQMNFQGVEEDANSRNVFLSGNSLICNALIEGDQTGVVLKELEISTSTIWNVIDMGNGLVMIRDISSSLYWTTRAGGDTVELAPLSNDSSTFQIFSKIDFTMNMIELFYLNAEGNRMIGYPRAEPVVGDILVLTERTENRAIFRTISTG